jgi:hyperosmotically inducible protein
MTESLQPYLPSQRPIEQKGMKMKLTKKLGTLLATSALLAGSAFGATSSVKETNPNLVNDVSKAINTLAWYGVFDALSAHIQDGVVTLNGSVMQYNVRNSAVAAVKNLPGVERVVDNIEILPLSPFDNNIRLRAYYAIFGDPALNRYALNSRPPIRILVKNGNIKLVGVVNNNLDRTLIYNRVMGLPGAFSVTNELRLDSDL